MPVELSVKDVREELQRVAGATSAGAGERATLVLGRLFHEVFADLVGRNPERSGVRMLLDLGLGRELWDEKLLEHTYRALVGPRLARSQAHLHETTEQVLVFWSAVQGLTRWLAELTWAVVEARPGQPPTWEEIADLLSAEVRLQCELREPKWTDSVRLTGIADSLLRRPGRDDFCALELKLGRTNPAVDLGQVALYHLIASRRAGAPASSALALIRFTPALEETLVTAEQVAGAQDKLLQLIGRMTGVLPEAPVAVTVGPRFLRFEARLGRGVTFDQVTRLTAEAGLKLGLANEPIVSRDAGRLTIDIARPDPQKVLFSAVVGELGARDARRGSAKLPIGVDIRRHPGEALLRRPLEPDQRARARRGDDRERQDRVAADGGRGAGPDEHPGDAAAALDRPEARGVHGAQALSLPRVEARPVGPGRPGRDRRGPGGPGRGDGRSLPAGVSGGDSGSLFSVDFAPRGRS
jgi:hypothetical protein